MKTALITLSSEGVHTAVQLSAKMEDACILIHSAVKESVPEACRFENTIELTAEIFNQYDALIYIAPCGIAVRAIGRQTKSKFTDPAVVCVDVGGRYAISLLSGHEGGANDLAVTVANIIGAEPVITTTTESLKNLIVGIGCRRGVDAETVIVAIKEALDHLTCELSHVRLLASADIKMDEAGLCKAAKQLGIPIRFISGEAIRSTTLSFDHSAFVEQKVNLPAVAEPAALLAGRRTTLILPKTVFNGVTIAVARESFSWSA
ncbi:MAG: cobalt-precorrin 5A hydrolase [Syntrophus sp. SKADARSKE-3]|nr:cobalt-precorrin 5A hydrolase [Syntrophus sp. SKADARSKE-3]